MRINRQTLLISMARAGLTNKALCEKSGLAAPTLVLLKSGNSNPKPATGKTSSNWARPAFCLPPTFTVYKVGGDYYTEQAYTPYSFSAADIFGNIIGGFTRVEQGTYVGTGTYGVANPNVLTFGFEPKLVITGTGAGVNLTTSGLTMVKGATRGHVTTTNSYGEMVTYSIIGNTASWYANGATSQQNSSGAIYPYIAIG